MELLLIYIFTIGITASFFTEPAPVVESSREIEARVLSAEKQK